MIRVSFFFHVLSHGFAQPTLCPDGGKTVLIADMAPKLYEDARREANESDDSDYVTTVDDRPYYPLLMVDYSDESSLIKAATTIVGGRASNDLRVVRVLGGNTNHLFRVSGFEKQGKVFDSVLVRVFGAEGLIDRDIETATFAALAVGGIAPPYLGRFGNGRLEGWLEAKALKVREVAIPKLCEGIAKVVAKLHRNFRVPPHLQEYHSEPTLWTQVFEWMDQALQSSFRTERDRRMAEELKLGDIPAELKWLREKVVPCDARAVLCHNDVLAANILLDKDDNMHLVDFEYGSVNYAGYDIANFFNEFAGGTDNPTGIPNYDWLPSMELQRRLWSTISETNKARRQTP